MTITNLRRITNWKRFVGVLSGLTLAVSVIPALGIALQLPVGDFSLCIACGTVQGGGFTCHLAFCAADDACDGEIVDTNGDGIGDAIRARCIQVPEGL
jgi:hypothetical protein